MKKAEKEIKFAYKHSWEVYFGYKDEDYHIDYDEQKILVYNNTSGEALGVYENADDLLDHCMVKGKSLRSILDDFDYMQM